MGELTLRDAQVSAESLNGFSSAPLGNHDVVELCSGGTRKSAKDPHPSLWLDEHGASYSFLSAVISETADAAQAGRRWWWLRTPALEVHAMTEQDSRGSHRLVQPRMGVSAAIAVEVAGDA